jgi:hypothetical protein
MANAAALLHADAAEPAGPAAGAARAHFDHADDRPAARNDVDLERTDAQVPRDDVVALSDEPVGDERLGALAASLTRGVAPQRQGFSPFSPQSSRSIVQTLVETGGRVGSKVVPDFTQ